MEILRVGTQDRARGNGEQERETADHGVKPGAGVATAHLDALTRGQ